MEREGNVSQTSNECNDDQRVYEISGFDVIGDPISNSIVPSDATSRSKLVAVWLYGSTSGINGVSYESAIHRRIINFAHDGAKDSCWINSNRLVDFVGYEDQKMVVLRNTNFLDVTQLLRVLDSSSFIYHVDNSRYAWEPRSRVVFRPKLLLILSPFGPDDLPGPMDDPGDSLTIVSMIKRRLTHIVDFDLPSGRESLDRILNEVAIEF